MLTAAAFVGCGSAKYMDTTTGWIDVIVLENMTYYVDTTSIERQGDMIIAKEKRLYEPISRQQYIDTIKERWSRLGKPEKAKAWADFSYNIYTQEYDCANRRSRVILVEDYDSKGMLIQRTISNPEKKKWVEVDTETVKDYTFFFVCDYEN